MKHNKVISALLALVATAAWPPAASERGQRSRQRPVRARPGVPAEYQGVAGEATLERADGDTTVSLQVTGLEPKTAYVAHLHTAGLRAVRSGRAALPVRPRRRRRATERDPPRVQLRRRRRRQGEPPSNREVPVGEAGSVVLHEAEDTTRRPPARRQRAKRSGPRRPPPRGGEQPSGGIASAQREDRLRGARRQPRAPARHGPDRRRPQRRAGRRRPGARIQRRRTRSASRSSPTSPTRFTSTAMT